MTQGMEHKEQGSDQGRMEALKMAVLMMSCCVAVIAVFALIPVVGWPLGVALGLAALVGMAVAHQRLMGHGRHH